MGRLKRPLILAMAMATAGLSADVARAGDDDHEEAYHLRQSHAILPLDDLLERAGVPRDARILAVESEHEHGRWVYEIEYVTADGHITEVAVDAATGEVFTEEKH